MVYGGEQGAVAISVDPKALSRILHSESGVNTLVDLKVDGGAPTKVLVKAGQQVDGFAQLKDDGTTACGCWIWSGAWTEKGNMMARRDNADPSGLGNTLGWAFAWPANRRVLYNRASCDPSGKPWDPKRKLIGWDGKAWSGFDVPDFKVDAGPDSGMNLVHHEPGGGGTLLRPGQDGGGAVPGALRAVRSRPRSEPTRCTRRW